MSKMGASESKAKAIVETMVNAGISVTQQVISENKTSISQINEIVMGGGCTINAKTLSMGNYAKVDMKSVTNAVMNSEFEQDVQNAIKQAADSAAKAGIGISSSESDSITRSVTSISTAVTNSVRNVMQTESTQHNTFKCKQGDEVNVVLFDMKNDIKTVSQMITSSEQVTQAQQSAKNDIAQEIKSLATGLDPTALIGIILAIVLVVGGGAFFGVNKAVNLLTSAQFWFIVSLVGTAGGLGLAMLRLGNGAVPPYKKDDKERNNAILIISLVVGGISAAALAVTGFMITRPKPGVMS
jgi:hypothetical protein